MDNQAEGSHGIHWTSSMSAHMLLHLTDVVAGGTKTSTGFKKVHLNACARSLNEQFKLSLTGDQIRNHLRYWKRKWQRITLLKHGISGALWDEENCIIGLAEEHYAEYIQVFMLPIYCFALLCIQVSGIQSLLTCSLLTT
jgi:hypothetical protein